MAGEDATGSFVADAFRTSIRATMQMGLPNNTANQPTFRWTERATFTTGDPSDRPYNWFTAPATPAPVVSDLAVPCAVEYQGNAGQGTEAGFLNETMAKLTLLDTEYNALIAHGGKVPDQVLIKHNVYNLTYSHVEALFSVDVWTFYCEAEDST
jgi:hypothetical protein